MPNPQRFSFFPNPAGGETVYSWLSRFHQMSGNRSFRASTLSMLSVAKGRAANEFPSYLPSLAIASNTPLDKIISTMTPYNYYAAFLPESLRVRLWEQLSEGKAEHLQSVLGVVANRMTPGQSLYCCHQCMNEDLDNYGFPFWHLEHQLTGVVVCERHHAHLHGVSRKNETVILPEPIEEAVSTAMEDRFATLIHDEQRESLHVSKDRALMTYRARMAEFGLLSQSGQIRMRLLRSLVNSHISNIPLGFRAFDYVRQQMNKSRYPESLFYLPHVNHHPLKHMVLIECLFENWSDFYQEVNSGNTLNSIAEDITPIAKPRAKLSAIAIRQLNAGKSLRSVSHSEGLSVSTLKILAQQAGITVDCRPSKIFKAIERSMWRKLIVGIPASEIAKLYDVSTGAVEQILRKHPDLVTLRRLIRFHTIRKRHRVTLLVALNENRDITRVMLQKLIRATYTWLFRYDKAWLYHELPPKIPKQQRFSHRSKYENYD